MNKNQKALIEAIAKSKNLDCADCCKKVLEAENPDEVIKEELKYRGSFMKAVLNGDIMEALNRADSENNIALHEISLDELS